MDKENTKMQHELHVQLEYSTIHIKTMTLRNAGNKKWHQIS